MLHQANGKNLTMKKTIAVPKDCRKFLGSPVTCGSQRVNKINRKPCRKECKRIETLMNSVVGKQIHIILKLDT